MNKSLKTLNQVLEDLDGKNFKLFIPSYQRGYRWTPTEVRQLLDDINEEQAGNRYFLQLLAVREDKTAHTLRIIDGQQRLTTVLLVLDCLDGGNRCSKLIEYETRNTIEGKTLDGYFKSEPSDVSVIEEFSPFEYLKALRGQTFRLYDVWTDDGAHGWEGVLADSVYLSSWQTKVKKNLRCELWVNQKTFKVAGGDFLTEPTFYISHDGKSFNLNVNGEFWGNWPEEKFKGIDFTATDIQRVLSKALAAICEAWSGFDVKGDSGCNPGDNVGSGDIWWNAAIPFKDLDELVSEEFSKKLCGSLAKVAAAFATLLPYRVSVNNNK